MGKHDVKVSCNACDVIFWQGNLIEWAIELGKKTPPKWYKIACRHVKETKHNMIVQYPSQTVDLFNALPLNEMRA